MACSNAAAPRVCWSLGAPSGSSVARQGHSNLESPESCYQGSYILLDGILYLVIIQR